MRWLVILCGLVLFYSHAFADNVFLVVKVLMKNLIWLWKVKFFMLGKIFI